MVDAALAEILVRGLRRGEEILSDASAEVPAVRQWKQGVEKRLDRRVYSNRTRRQQPQPGIGIRHGSNPSNAQAIDQRFEGRKKERAVSPDRPAQHSAELVPLERRD